MYLHGLALGDCELALRGLLGDGAPLSASAILRLKATWQAQYTAWQQRDLFALFECERNSKSRARHGT